MLTLPIGRRGFLQGAAGLASALAVAGPAGYAAAEGIEDVRRGAEKEGALFWYDSLGGGEGALDAFQKAHPFIKNVKYVRVPGAQKVSRFVQELLAGGPSGDFLNQGAPGNEALAARGLAVPVDWAGLGVPAKLIGNKYLISTMTVVTVIIYNTNQVKGAAIPRTWAAMLDPRWKGRTGKYARAAEFDAIAVKWGKEKTLEYARRYAALNPRLASGTALLNQAVGSGELLVGFTAYDSAVRLKKSGAPVDFVAPEDGPVVVPLYSIVAKYGAHPNAAKLMLSWMATPAGAKAFEDHVLRGNAFVPGTVAAQLVGKTENVISRTPDDMIKNAKAINAFDKEIENILKGRG